MDVLAALDSRVSVSPSQMGEPGPSDLELSTILRAGARAPDHGKLRPWRFLIVRGEARAALGHVFADALRRRQPDVPEAVLDSERARALRAPLLIVVVARVDPEHRKIPVQEQLCSAAAAAENMLLAAHGLGYASKWTTGQNAFDPFVRERLGLGAHDRIVGFLNIGTLRGEPPARRPADPAEVSTEWLGPGQERPLAP